MDAFFELPEIMDDTTHPQYENLQIDIANIDIEELHKYVEENKINRFLERFDNKHLAKCRFYLVDKIRNQLSTDRLEILADTSLSAPYTSTNLEGLTILENNLVYSSEFTSFGNAFKYGDYVYHLSPCTDASNSSYWISEAIRELISVVSG